MKQEPTMTKSRRFSAWVGADMIHALEPMIKLGQGSGDLIGTEGLYIERCAQGGALLYATNREAFAVLHDPDASIAGEGIGRFWISDAFFRACTPPLGIAIMSDGEAWDVALPEWAQPGWAKLTPDGAAVLPKMPRPSSAAEEITSLWHGIAEFGNVYHGGYRLMDGDKGLPWRRLVRMTTAVRPDRVCVDPMLVGMFVGRVIERLAGARQQVTMDLGSVGDPILIRIGGRDDFLGIVMPQKHRQVEPLPGWATEAT